MKTITPNASERGVALVIVLWVLVVLSLLIGGFAFTMHVETQVTSFSRKEIKAEALARSGVELARLQLLQHAKTPAETGFESFDQPWAASEIYSNHSLGDGVIQVRVADEESRLPVNQLDEELMRHLLQRLDLELLDTDVVIDSILDWMDEDDLHRINGAEDEYYQELPVPYRAKNAPIDHVEELLLVRGVTHELYYGRAATERDPAQPGLKDLFTSAKTSRVNVNTASALVLQAALDIDSTRAASIADRRNGPDGVLGTKDDRPFRTISEFMNEFGTTDAAQSQRWQAVAGVSSRFFRVTATGEVGGVQRTITSVLCVDGNDFTPCSWTVAHGGAR